MEVICTSVETKLKTFWKKIGDINDDEIIDMLFMLSFHHEIEML